MHFMGTLHVNADDKVSGYILEVSGLGRTAYLNVTAGDGTGVTFILNKPEFLDRLSNEADRLCREFVGDVPAALEIVVAPGPLP